MLLYIDLDVGRVAGLRTARRPNGQRWAKYPHLSILNTEIQLLEEE